MTKIQWTDATWNPLRARDKRTGKVGHYCEMLSPGCANCYASALQPRLFGLPRFPGQGKRVALPLVEDRVPVSEDREVFLDTKVLRQPLAWKKPRMVFVCSMSDLFGAWVQESWLDAVFRLMHEAKQHTFQVLTKRSERMRDYCARRWGRFDGKDYPLAPNIWLGVSVENQKEKQRIEHLRQTPAAVRFLSCEPLLEDLGDLELNDLRLLRRVPELPVGNQLYPRRGDLHWVITGGESGPKARACHEDWEAAILRQCQAAHVPAFRKQAGSNAWRGGQRVNYRDPKGGNPEEWPAALCVRQFPEPRRS